MVRRLSALGLSALAVSACTALISLDGYYPASSDASDASSAADATAQDDATGANDAGGDSNVPTNVLFEDFFTGDLSRWTATGTGTWAITNGELIQSSESSASAQLVVTGSPAANDYRISTKMRYVAGSAFGAMQVTFRVDPVSYQEWRCNWEPVPNAGFLYLRLQEENAGGSQNTVADVELPVPPGYSMTAPVTMEVVVVGTSVDCSIREIAGATTSLSVPLTRLTGTFGVKTYNLKAAFDDFRVVRTP